MFSKVRNFLNLVMEHEANQRENSLRLEQNDAIGIFRIES
jgi:hypothetical protein